MLDVLKSIPAEEDPAHTYLMEYENTTYISSKNKITAWHETDQDWEGYDAWIQTMRKSNRSTIPLIRLQRCDCKCETHAMLHPVSDLETEKWHARIANNGRRWYEERQEGKIVDPTCASEKDLRL